MTTPLARFTIVMALILGLSAALIEAQAFDVKKGRWLWTMTVNKFAFPPSVTPAQRAQAEQVLKAMKEFPACISDKELKDLQFGKLEDDDSEDCTVTSRKSSSAAFDLVRTCTGDNPRVETIHGAASSREAMRLTISSTTKNGPGEVLMVGRWTGDVCGKDD